MGKCKPGSYWCHTDEKCKKIPAGFMLDRAGMLRKENGHTQDSEVKESHGKKWKDFLKEAGIDTGLKSR